jgi:hypothetical protein
VIRRLLLDLPGRTGWTRSDLKRLTLRDTATLFHMHP